jgi:hypothetical protein
VRHYVTNGYLGIKASWQVRVVPVPSRVGVQSLPPKPHILKFSSRHGGNIGDLWGKGVIKAKTKTILSDFGLKLIYFLRHERGWKSPRSIS